MEETVIRKVAENSRNNNHPWKMIFSKGVGFCVGREGPGLYF